MDFGGVHPVRHDEHAHVAHAYMHASITATEVPTCVSQTFGVLPLAD